MPEDEEAGDSKLKGVRQKRILALAMATPITTDGNSF